MDLELVAWVLIFLGGYGAVLGWLLRIAMGKKADGPGGP
jgi:hypothetical protein